jgi:hypothetical protein
MRLCSVTGLPYAVEVELALLDELHRRRVRHELRDRTGAEQRTLRVDGALGRNIGVTVALLRNHLAAFDDDDDAARDVRCPHRIGHEAIEPRLDVGARELCTSCIRAGGVAGQGRK